MNDLQSGMPERDKLIDYGLIGSTEPVRPFDAVQVPMPKISEAKEAIWADEKPLPLRRPPQKQESYPLEALGRYGEAAKAIAEHVGAPLPMVANSILGMLSLSTQGIAISA